MEGKTSQSMSLKILVEKEKNRFVFAEADTDFIDVLFSFLTIPIGAIIKLTREHFLKEEIGCLNNLYESLQNLDEKYQANEHKDVLLQPRCATDVYCRNLKVNLAESNRKYCVCLDDSCDFLSYEQTDFCPCGRTLELEVNLSPVPQDGGVFLKPTARFMITDDFQVLPMSTMTGLSLLINFAALDGGKFEERTLNMGKDEVLKLLKCSLASRTPFSDAILEPPFSKIKPPIINHGKYGPRRTRRPQREVDTSNKDQEINLKLIINRLNNTALYAEVEENFVDILCSFLSLPLSHVFREFPHLSFKGCTSNLYKSVQDFDINMFFKSEEMKEIVLHPKLPPGIAYDNRLIGIEEAVNPSLSSLSSLFTTKFTALDSEQSVGGVKMSSRLVKGPSMFMVTDSLYITPLSPISGITLINRLKVPFSYIQELDVTMGEEETLRLLAASLVSRSALTDAFMLKEPKQKPRG